MEVGCQRHPGASTIGSQLLDGACSHGWQILVTWPSGPMQSSHHTDEVVKRQGGTREGTPLSRVPVLETWILEESNDNVKLLDSSEYCRNYD